MLQKFGENLRKNQRINRTLSFLQIIPIGALRRSWTGCSQGSPAGPPPPPRRAATTLQPSPGCGRTATPRSLRKLAKFENLCKFLAGSFSPVSKRNFARKYAFDNIFQALQDLHTFAPLQSQNFRKKSV